MARREINFINLITDLKKAGRSNKDELISILYRYDIPKIESLQRRVLEYVFSIHDDELRLKFINMLAEANNLPIMHECYCVIYSDAPKNEYISYQVKNVGSSRESLNLKYETCMNIINQSSYLQGIQEAVNSHKGNITNAAYVSGPRVISRRYRNKGIIRY
jgi:hypothetical protein